MDAREQWWKRRRELGWKDCGRVKRGGISNMLGQMHDPTVVCHSCRFRSFQYILVPSKRFLLSPFPSSYNRLPLLVALFIQPPLPSICFLFLIVHFSRLPPSRSPLDRPFFSSFSRNYSFHCCMYGYIQSSLGILFTTFATQKGSCFKNVHFIIYLRQNLYNYIYIIMRLDLNF